MNGRTDSAPHAEAVDRLVVTVDVECDSDGGPTWRYSDPLGFRGVSHGLAEVLTPMLHATGARATLLISNVVLKHDPSVSILRDLPDAELGTHLHGDFLEPNPRFREPAGAKTVENQNEYTEEIERAKLVNLGSLFADRVGRTPTAFRAGRWSAGGRTARLLAEMGYVVDSSVSPGVHWTDGGRSVDYSLAPLQPYRPDRDDITRPGQLGIWELPVSIAPLRRVRRQLVWLRPSLSSPAQMRRVVRAFRRRFAAPRTFVMMLHNTELTPGASPHSRTDEDAKRVAAHLRDFLMWARDDGFEFAGLTEAARSCAS